MGNFVLHCSWTHGILVVFLVLCVFFFSGVSKYFLLTLRKKKNCFFFSTSLVSSSFVFVLSFLFMGVAFMKLTDVCYKLYRLLLNCCYTGIYLYSFLELLTVSFTSDFLLPWFPLSFFSRVNW